MNWSGKLPASKWDGSNVLEAAAASGISIAPERFDRDLVAEVARRQSQITERSLPEALPEPDGGGDLESDVEADNAPPLAVIRDKQPRPARKVCGLDRPDSPHPHKTSSTALAAQEAKVADAESSTILDRIIATTPHTPWYGVGQFFIAPVLKPPPPPEDDGLWTSDTPAPFFEV